MALKFIPIYCAQKAVKDRRWQYDHRESLGRCYASQVDGEWRCACCGTPVKVVW